MRLPYLTPLGLRIQERRRPDLCWRLPGAPANTCALTIDDGPSAKYTPGVLEVLREEGVRATFFILGDRVMAFPEELRAIYEAGHGIALHGDTHVECGKGTGSTVLRMATNRTVIEAVLGESCLIKPYFRPPFGHWPRKAKSQVLGYHIVMSSILPGDLLLGRGGISWVEDPARCAAQVRRELHAGAIITLHASERLAGADPAHNHGIHDTPRAAETVRAVCGAVKEAGFGVVELPRG